MNFENNIVNYEAFGAIGDGITDDLPAICKAHEHANKHGLSVVTKPDAAYNLGGQALTVAIATNTDWNTSRFIIDDTQVENHQKPVFEVVSLLEPETLSISKLTRDQKQVDARPERDCHVLVENDKKRLYIRRGPNQNTGVPQHDSFILRQNGSIQSPIDWEYDEITRIEAHPIDDTPLILRGGVFTTFANRMNQATGYNYWARNIVISRSNTEVDNLTHYIAGETDVGQPYSGFIAARQCSDITLRNCFATGHKTYFTMSDTGKRVKMGSYDYAANNVVNFRMTGCRMNHIMDKTRWGVIGTNFCKNITIEDCVLSRMDTHMGVSGIYEIRNCTMGYMGVNAIGRGRLTIENSTLYGKALVRFRSDYGSTWEGELVIRNCRWTPDFENNECSYMINVDNDGTHDFGYPCQMPAEIMIDELFVDDKNHTENYKDMYFFTDPNSVNAGAGKTKQAVKRPFPYQQCRKLIVRGLTIASGKKPRICLNAELEKNTVVIME